MSSENDSGSSPANHSEKTLRRQRTYNLKPAWSTGSGYDVHQFADGRTLYLGGVEIPHDRGLLGHSDADVLLHAIMDALLGAAGLKDIGTWFPPGDAEWKDARSTDLLEKVCELIDQEKRVIGNIDATVIAEVPKIKPYIDEMKKVIGSITGLPPERIGIKATTNEEMGFVGRREGIAAIASALCLKLSV